MLDTLCLCILLMLGLSHCLDVRLLGRIVGSGVIDREKLLQGIKLGIDKLLQHIHAALHIVCGMELFIHQCHAELCAICSAVSEGHLCMCQRIAAGYFLIKLIYILPAHPNEIMFKILYLLIAEVLLALQCISQLQD